MMKKKCVFLVDDNKDFLEAFTIDAPDSWDLYTFESPFAALESITEKSPSVVISDIQMNETIHGTNLLDIVSIISKDISLIAISGFSRDYISGHFGPLRSEAKFFVKPLDEKSMNEILKIVESSKNIDLSQEMSFEYVDESLHRLKNILMNISAMEKNDARANIEICFLALGLDQEEGKKLASKLGVAI